VIAIGDGVVSRVHDIDVNPEGEGSMLIIWHVIPGEPQAFRSYVYGQVSNIRVRSDEHVKRGQILADAWVSTTDPRWVPRVHLQILGQGSIEQRNPLRFLAGCRSQVAPDALIYPVEC